MMREAFKVPEICLLSFKWATLSYVMLCNNDAGNSFTYFSLSLQVDNNAAEIVEVNSSRE